MKIKKFTAKTYRIALDMIKAEFGDNAVILGTNEKKGKQSYVEITAAIDYDEVLPDKNKSAESGTFFAHHNFGLSNLHSLYKNKHEEIKTEGSEQDDIGKNVDGVKFSVSKDQFLSSDKKSNKVNFLRKDSVEIEKFPAKRFKLDDTYNINLSRGNKIEISVKPKNCKVIMIIGPTGVGKTTTVAKLSANALREGKKVGLISLDNYRIGALEQIRIYARVMGIPLLPVSSPEALKDGISRFVKNRDLVVIDTMGRNPKDESYIKFLAEICLIGFPIEIHLLLSANSDNEFILEAVRFYNELPISYIGLTKVDEAVRLNNIENLLGSCRKPLAYITTGQKVPDDIEFTSSIDISTLLSNTRANTC